MQNFSNFHLFKMSVYGRFQFKLLMFNLDVDTDFVIINQQRLATCEVYFEFWTAHLVWLNLSSSFLWGGEIWAKILTIVESWTLHCDRHNYFPIFEIPFWTGTTSCHNEQKPHWEFRNVSILRDFEILLIPAERWNFGDNFAPDGFSR